MKFNCKIFKVLAVVCILVLSSGCFLDEYDLSGDPYNYAGTWIGQRSPTTFAIFKIAHIDSKKYPVDPEFQPNTLQDYDFYILSMIEYGLKNSNTNSSEFKWDSYFNAEKTIGVESGLKSIKFYDSINKEIPPSRLILYRKIVFSREIMDLFVDSGNGRINRFQRVYHDDSLKEKVAEMEKNIVGLMQKEFRKKNPHSEFVVTNGISWEPIETMSKGVIKQAEIAREKDY